MTAELVRRPSVTPADAGCLDLIGARLAALGFALVRLPRNGVDNLWAVHGEHGPCLAFAGHTDVVPPGPLEEWRTPPFEPVVQDGMLYGRGAADMKGSLAAMVVAVERYLARTPAPRGRIAFILTSDEEGPATDGTVRVMEYLAAKAIEVDWCIVGEPSSTTRLGDTIRVGRRGSLNGRLTVHGTQGHVAYPARADNPIHRLAPALAELVARQWDAGNAYYPPTSFQVSNLNAGTGAENVIPGVLTARFNFRFSTASTAAGLRAAVHETLDRHGLRYALDWQLSGDPFLTAGGRLVETASAVIAERLGVTCEQSTGGGTSDGRFIAPRGIELIELGPNNATIHKVDECVALDELERLSEVYEEIVTRLLGA
ncbi:MAG: succinyl-diaminopimelate desuccinylase [Gammaproteobacteria bacterium]|nr:succinyl-diaminopimelate desuccinylase [Gammaproteobacteria bacterium]MCP5201330.1 succinyl-diaminopimelate desuccinylase [Gammaproteobacteria bacterium]